MSWNAIMFTLVFVGVIVIVSAIAFSYALKPKDIAVLGFIAFAIIILAFAAAVLWQIGTGDIQLYGLISEPAGRGDTGDTGKASLSRFQFLIFTFVIAGLFLMLCIETGAFVDIPTNVLGLLGISGGSFVISKAVGQARQPEEEGGEADEEDGKPKK
jgi:steroid 5-alpha reductase family enzyme